MLAPDHNPVLEERRIVIRLEQVGYLLKKAGGWKTSEVFLDFGSLARSSAAPKY
jgi:hypothetical protein